MKKLAILFTLATGFLGTQCGLNRQVTEAKAMGDCRFTIASADSIFLAGIDIRQFKSLTDLDLAKYPQIGLALLRRDVPLKLRVNVDVTNPTKQLAAINQLEYKILLKESELTTGFLTQRIEVAPYGGQTQVPVRLNANAYQLLTDDKTREAFLQLVKSLSGAKDATPTHLTLKIKPTLALGNKQVNYPGYITVDQEVSSKMLLGQ